MTGRHSLVRPVPHFSHVEPSCNVSFIQIINTFVSACNTLSVFVQISL